MIMLKMFKSHHKRFFRFACVGVLNTGLDLLVFSICFYLFGFHYLLAHIFGFLLANANSYYWNSSWTFDQQKQEFVLGKATVFFIVSLVGLILSSIALHFFIIITAPFISVSYYPHLWGKLFASAVSLVWNYYGSWVFVFKKS